MTEHEAATTADSERPKPSVRHLAGSTPAAKKVVGARRNPSVVGYDGGTAPRWLRVAAGWSWRILIVLLAVALVFWATSRVLLVFVAVFLALVFTAVLRPLVNLLARAIPRGLAVVVSFLVSIAAVGGIFAYIGFSVAGQWEDLLVKFNDGIAELLSFFERPPFNLTITAQDTQGWIDSAREWITDNSGTIASQALSGVGSVIQGLITLALATFITVFLLLRGKEMWHWFLNQLPARARESWHIGGGVAWYTFSGYTRGTFIIAAANGAMALIALLLLGVPLAAPLAVLVFVGAFIPLIGAPAAMVVAILVALAANGPLNAIIVGLVIAGIGQIEGHILQPLVMGKQVSLHPVVVAIGVAAGTLIAGILGAIIAIPLISVAWSVFARLRVVDPPTDFDELDEDGEPAPPDEILSDAPAGQPSG